MGERNPAPERRQLSPTPDWLTGIVVRFVGTQTRVRCRECDGLLCSITHNDSLWVLADVARDHRQFCRDKEERNG